MDLVPQSTKKFLFDGPKTSCAILKKYLILYISNFSFREEGVVLASDD